MSSRCLPGGCAPSVGPDASGIRTSGTRTLARWIAPVLIGRSSSVVAIDPPDGTITRQNFDKSCQWLRRNIRGYRQPPCRRRERWCTPIPSDGPRSAAGAVAAPEA